MATTHACCRLCVSGEACAATSYNGKRGRAEEGAATSNLHPPLTVVDGLKPQADSRHETSQAILPFLQRADEIEAVEPKVAYYCRMCAVDTVRAGAATYERLLGSAVAQVYELAVCRALGLAALGVPK